MKGQIRRLLVGLVLALTVRAEEPPVLTAEFRQFSAARDAELRQQHGDDDDILLQPGLLADRGQRLIEIVAVATGVAAGSPAEFFVVADGGNDYEALTMTPVLPLHLYQAMDFIGVPTGQPVDPTKYRFWPRGPRIQVLIVRGGEAIPIERFVVDDRRQGPLAELGLTYVGCPDHFTTDKQGQRTFQPDILGNIAADYNERWALFDVPYRAEQGVVYNHLTPNPKLLLPRGERLIVRLLPVADFSTVTVAATVVPSVDDPFDIRLDDARPIAFASFLTRLQQEMAVHDEVYLRLRFAPELQVGAAQAFCRLLHELVERSVVRLETGGEDLYYQAFLPQEKWRPRKGRLLQPLELHLTDVGGGVVVELEEKFEAEKIQLREQRREFAAVDELPGLLPDPEKRSSSVVFIYAPSTLTYAKLHAAYLAVRAAYPTAFVFPPADDAD